ncbi:DNA binding protein [Myotisia sp. PD_48]|nr:DNA binding protein [Myotisia sp. PD_48]
MATTTVTRPKLSTAVRAPNEVPVQDLMVSAISGTTISQAVKQQQSLALVQIMLHASLGTLFYLRELLPLSCFGDCDLRAISTSDSSLSYEEFLGGHLKPPVETGGRGQPLKVILRNLNEKADRILDLLVRLPMLEILGAETDQP